MKVVDKLNSDNPMRDTLKQHVMSTGNMLNEMNHMKHWKEHMDGVAMTKGSLQKFITEAATSTSAFHQNLEAAKGTLRAMQ